MKNIKFNLFIFIIVLFLSFVVVYNPTFAQGSLDNFNLQTVPRIFSGLACYFVRFGVIVTGIAIIASGIAFFLSRGNSVAYEGAKKFFFYAVIGGLVIYGVYTIILSVSLLITGSTTLPWIPLTCP